MGILTTDDAALELLKLLGLEGQKVHSITIKFEAEEFVKIEVDMYGQETTMNRLIGWLMQKDIKPFKRREYWLRGDRGTGHFPMPPGK